MLQLVTTIHKPIASSRTSGYITPQRILVEQVIIPAVIVPVIGQVWSRTGPKHRFAELSVAVGDINHI